MARAHPQSVILFPLMETAPALTLSMTSANAPAPSVAVRRIVLFTAASPCLFGSGAGRAPFTKSILRFLVGVEKAGPSFLAPPDQIINEGSHVAMPGKIQISIITTSISIQYGTEPRKISDSLTDLSSTEPLTV